MTKTNRRTGDIAGILALVIALAALGGTVYMYLKPEMGSKGLSGYDFSTPEAAVKSEFQIRKNGDARALIEFLSASETKIAQERLDTFEAKMEAEFDNKRLLFFTFKDNDKPVYRVMAFERNSRGQWVRSDYDYDKLRRDDQELFAQVQNWQREGKLDTKVKAEPRKN